MMESQTDELPIAPTRLLPPSLGPAPDDSDDDVTGDSMEVVIRPRSGWIAVNWKELFSYRELLWFLVWRDIAVRYKQTILGSAWAVLQPMMTMLIFTLVFGRIARLPSMGFPYPVFVFAGLIPWTLFSQGMPQAAQSLVNQQQMLTKVYFPRLFVPTAAAAVYLLDLLISLGLYSLILAHYRVTPAWTVVFLPLLILLTLIATLGIGYLFTAVMVFYRDIRHAIPFLTQMFLYVSFVIYPGSEIKRDFIRYLLSLNPMFGLIMAYRSAILPGVPWDLPCLAISTASAVAIFVFALFYFRRTERAFADFI
jgi:lipopolysaccharide transport system permease protein